MAGAIGPCNPAELEGIQSVGGAAVVVGAVSTADTLAKRSRRISLPGTGEGAYGALFFSRMSLSIRSPAALRAAWIRSKSVVYCAQ